MRIDPDQVIQLSENFYQAAINKAFHGNQIRVIYQATEPDKLTYLHLLDAEGADIYSHIRRSELQRIQNIADNLLNAEKRVHLSDILKSMDETTLFQLEKDLAAEGGDALRALFKEKVGCVKAWEVAAKHNDEIRKSTDFLTNLSDKIDEFPNLPEDLTDDVVFDAVKKFHDNLPQSYEIIDDLVDDVVDVIANKTKNSKSPEFWKWIQRGRKFEKEYLLPRLKNRASDEYIQLREKVQNTCDVNLDQYDMYSQVQFKYNDVGDYFVADQVYVKWGKDVDGLDEIQDIVVVEDKLSSGTRLTTNQNGGKAANSLTVRSNNSRPESSVSGLELPKNVVIDTNNKWIKIYDSEKGDVISDIIRL